MRIGMMEKRNGSWQSIRPDTACQKLRRAEDLLAQVQDLLTGTFADFAHLERALSNVRSIQQDIKT